MKNDTLQALEEAFTSFQMYSYVSAGRLGRGEAVDLATVIGRIVGLSRTPASCLPANAEWLSTRRRNEPMAPHKLYCPSVLKQFLREREKGGGNESPHFTGRSYNSCSMVRVHLTIVTISLTSAFDIMFCQSQCCRTISLILTNASRVRSKWNIPSQAT